HRHEYVDTLLMLTALLNRIANLLTGKEPQLHIMCLAKRSGCPPLKSIKKIIPRFIGPYEIIRPDLSIFIFTFIKHFMFPRLNPFRLAYCALLPSPFHPQAIDGHLAYDICQIMDSCQQGCGWQYLVDWMVYGPEGWSWMPSSFILGPDFISDYRSSLPSCSFGLPGGKCPIWRRWKNYFGAMLSWNLRPLLRFLSLSLIVMK
uniref:Uncharacterized protein n=1 Tax=Poecilia reticulata TaxID=8081 RepID=A0A3P9P7C1_POERE